MLVPADLDLPKEIWGAATAEPTTHKATKICVAAMVVMVAVVMVVGVPAAVGDSACSEKS